MSNKKEIFLIPYSHLDTQWRWEFPTTIQKYIKNTMDESLHLFEKYPHHRFNFTGTIRYQMMRDYFPEGFEKVKALITQDRWSLAGTCLDETDCLVPSVESNVRNILYGDQWQKHVFGKSSRDYMIPDCFGFPINLPTVMNHCGIHGFSSNKLTWGSAVGVPFEIGMWQGPDGSEIVSAFNPCRYDSHLELPIYLDPGRLARLNRLGKKNDIWKSFQYYGVGDIGGAPLESSVKQAKKSMDHYQEKNADIVVKQGSADEFFYGVTDAEKAKMDRYQGDLLLTEHSAGTITSATIMKRWNRKNEQLAFAAESAAVMAMQVAGTPYPNDKIKRAWERVIGSQMHDILPGTSTPLAYEYSQNDEVIALNTWTGILNDSAKAMAPFVVGKGSVLLFNPLETSRYELVDLVLPALSMDKNYILKDADGQIYPLQLREENSQIIGIFKPKLGPFAWAKYEVVEVKTDIKQDLNLIENESEYILQNSFYQVTITKDGCVSSIKDRLRNRELLKKPMAYEFQKERPMKFPAWNMDWRDRKKKPFLRIDKGGRVAVLENGPLRITLRITISHHRSTFVKDVSLGYESDLVEFTERISWQETGCSFKLALNSTMDHPTATYNWETARVNRGVNHKRQYEVPSRMWVDLSEKDFGFSIVEDSKYGYDRPDESTLRMTLIYTPALRYINGFWDQKSHDFGQHTIRYGVKAHDGNWKATDVEARKFNQRVRAFDVQCDSKEENVIETIGLLKIHSEQVGCTAIKRAEQSEDIIVRLYERYGMKAKTCIEFTKPILEAYVVNGIEDDIEKACFDGQTLSVDVPASGMKAYKVKFEEKLAVGEFEALALPYNYAMIGSNKEVGTAVLPRELMPEKIAASTIDFSVKVHEKLNAVKTSGQTLYIQTDRNKLSLLTAADCDVEALYQWLDEQGNLIIAETVVIPMLTGFRGLWDTRTWSKPPKHHLKNQRDYAWLNKCTGVLPGFVKRDRIEWYVTHLHENGKDRPYQYAYLSSVSLKIPEGAKQLVLPKQPTYLIAATLHDEGAQLKSAQYLTDPFDF